MLCFHQTGHVNWLQLCAGCAGQPTADRGTTQPRCPAQCSTPGAAQVLRPTPSSARLWASPRQSPVRRRPLHTPCAGAFEGHSRVCQPVSVRSARSQSTPRACAAQQRGPAAATAGSRMKASIPAGHPGGMSCRQGATCTAGERQTCASCGPPAAPWLPAEGSPACTSREGWPPAPRSTGPPALDKRAGHWYSILLTQARGAVAMQAAATLAARALLSPCGCCACCRARPQRASPPACSSPSAAPPRQGPAVGAHAPPQPLACTREPRTLTAAGTASVRQSSQRRPQPFCSSRKEPTGRASAPNLRAGPSHAGIAVAAGSSVQKRQQGSGGAWGSGRFVCTPRSTGRLPPRTALA